MDYLSTMVMAVVEGLTEFLPISSTGHLILTAKVLNITQSEFLKSFEIIIQLGAISAVVFLYWPKLKKDKGLWLKIFVAFLPTAVLGFIFYKFIKDVLLGNVMITLLALFSGGLILIITETLTSKKESSVQEISELSLGKAALIGFVQSVSMIPGVSRSAATILGGLYLGLKRKTAVEFSFLLAIPTMLAASGWDALKSNFEFSTQEFLFLALGFGGAFFSAILSVKYFVRYVETHNLALFGVYRILLALVFWLLIL